MSTTGQHSLSLSLLRPDTAQRISQAVSAAGDPNLLGGVLVGDSWRAWRVLLIAAMGEELTDEERVVFTQLTGRDREPGRRVEELVGVIGRRGGKSRAVATLACYLSALCDHPTLVAGEVGVLLVIAPDTQQAAITLGYIGAAFEASPVLRRLVKSKTATKLRLTNGVEIAVRASDFRRLRGATFVAAIGDEACFWMNAERSMNPDSEIVAAVRPGLATTGGPLILISSPHARRGEVWNIYRRHFGPKGDPAILVAQAPSRTMNASLSQSVVDRAMERDPQAASAEFGAVFRSDLEAFVSRETVEGLRGFRDARAGAGGGGDVQRFHRPGGWLWHRQHDAGHRPLRSRPRGCGCRRGARASAGFQPRGLCRRVRCAAAQLPVRSP
jgi:hypothetical protein